MKTENLDKWLRAIWPHNGHPKTEAEIRAAVAEDMRAACEIAWEIGFGFHESLSKCGRRVVIPSNPYARKDTP